MHDATRERFARTAERVAELQDARAAELEQQVVRFVAPAGDERALDSGTGAGALAFALAPHVREVVAVDLVPELLEQGRKRGAGFPNVTFVEGDATKLPFELGSFDLAASLRTLHHIARPELAVAQLTRVTRQRGRVLVVDQIAPVDPLAALELNAFERAHLASAHRLIGDHLGLYNQSRRGQWAVYDTSPSRERSSSSRGPPLSACLAPPPDGGNPW